MGNLISIFQEIFMLKEDNTARIGLSDFRQEKAPVSKPSGRIHAPKELKLSELMRKGCC